MRRELRGIALGSAIVFIAPALLLVEGCASSKKQKGTTAKGNAAKTEGLENGSVSAAARDKAKDLGATVEKLLCDAVTEGVGWCDSDTAVVFCTGGTWYKLDCAATGLGVCAIDDAKVVDCVNADDTE
jgi:hypothetical protein